MLAVLSLLNGCAGRTTEEPAPVQLSGGSTSTGGAGGSSGQSTLAAGGVFIPPPGLGGSPGRCPSRSFNLDVHSAQTAPEEEGVWIETLQAPPPVYVPLFGAAVNTDPETWDRSALPAGAGVFRLHGIDASCYPHGGYMYYGGSGDGPIEPYNFYETSQCESLPGCPSATVNDQDWGAWWYLTGNQTAADLIVCAQLFDKLLRASGIQLDLSSSGPTCRN
ncbi:MAG TPA: hypothetical protein VFQ61_35880 [Polyangiaceae bacterium]|nr:hypothetical protein [Polyangiaceae bacterium]